VAGPAATVQGIVRHDAGNDCIMLESQGSRFPVVWPDGTRGVAARPDVELPDRRSPVVGDTVSGGGGYLLAGASYIEEIQIPAACNTKHPRDRGLHPCLWAFEAGCRRAGGPS
jgi:hypothetical protein